MLVMNKRGMGRLLRSRFTIGGDMAAAAGPVGRTVQAETDALLSAELLSYSRSRGIFAGVALSGTTLRQDSSVNSKLYGRAYTNRDIVTTNIEPPAQAAQLLSLLNKYSSRTGE